MIRRLLIAALVAILLVVLVFMIMWAWIAPLYEDRSSSGAAEHTPAATEPPHRPGGQGQPDRDP